MTPAILNRLRNEVWDIAPNYLESYISSIEQAAKLEDVSNLKMSREAASLVSQHGDVAVIDIGGVTGKRLDVWEKWFGMVDYDDIAEALDMCQGEDSIKNIVLSFNSPGGSHIGTQECADLIHASTKPVYAFTDCCMASAAYYLGSQAKAIFATPTAMVGSIGCIMVRRDDSGMLSNLGINITAFYRGKHKADGRIFKPLSKAESADLNAFVEKAYSDFKSTVLRARTPSDEVFESKIYHAETAIELGLADGLVNNLQEVFAVIS